MHGHTIGVLRCWEALIKTMGIGVNATREDKIPNHRDDPVVPIWSRVYRKPSEWVGLVEC